MSLHRSFFRSALPISFLATLVFLLAASSVSASAATLFAVTTNSRLVSFSSDDPCVVTDGVQITGLQMDETILGIDFRPATGQLYGLGSSSRLYVIDTNSGVASPIGPGPFAPTLSGASFGFDFNPTVDRIRIVSDTGQNLRAHPDNGVIAVIDTPLAFAAGDINAGAMPFAVGAAYTNPDNDPATGTTLYDLDSELDILVSQSPPNNGVLNTIGALGVNVNDVAGFDISSTNTGYAAVHESGKTRPRGNQCGTSSLMTIDLASGIAERLGFIGTRQPIRSLAVQLGMQ
jgi:hypothetical protein